MIDDVKFEVQEEALKVKNDADVVRVFFRLFKRFLCCCAPIGVLSPVVAQANDLRWVRNSRVASQPIVDELIRV